MHSDNVHCLLLPLLVAAYCAVYLMPSSLLFVASCHTVAIGCILCSLLCCHILHSLLFVATCCTVAIGAAYCAVYFCCHTPYSSIFVAACHAVCYLLPLSVAACCTVAICCCMLYSLLFAAAICYHMPYSCYLLPHAVQLLRIATCSIVCYLLLLSFATHHTVAMCYCILCSHYFMAVCCVVAIYLLPDAIQLLFVATGCRMLQVYRYNVMCYSYSLSLSLLS